MSIGGHTVLTGVAGWPVGHSRSPAIHNHWFAVHGIDGAYVPLPIEPNCFTTAIRGLQAAGFRGVNVTVPHKEAAMAVADRHDESARRIGAANTLSFDAAGTITAFNTDAAGFMASLRAAAPAWRNTEPAIVLGAGGAARAVICALIDAGVGEIGVVNRSLDRAEGLQAQFGRDLEVLDWDNHERWLVDCTLLVNATTLGMRDQPPMVLPLDPLPATATVVDLVYAPLETGLLHAARARDLIAVDGLGMLLHQAAAAFSLWFGVEPLVDEELRRIVLAAP